MKKQAIIDLHAKGWTRANIKTTLGVSTEEIQDALGKGKAGAKPKSKVKTKVELKVEDKTSKSKVTPIIHDFVLLDRSTSMRGDRINASVDGILKYVEDMSTKQKEKKIESHFTLVEFSDKVRPVKINSIDPSKGVSINKNVDGNTALYDAIAEAIRLANVLVEKKGTKNFVTITAYTDGEENSSTFRAEALRTMIEESKAKGWTIAFVGSGNKFTVESTAKRIGIDTTNVLAYDASNKESVINTMTKMSSSRSMSTDSISVNKFSNTNYFKED